MCIHTPFLCSHLLRVIFWCRLLHSNVCKVNIMVVDRIQGKSSVWESSKSTPIQPCLVGKNFGEKSLSPEERRFWDRDMPWWQYWERAFKGGEGVRIFFKINDYFSNRHFISLMLCTKMLDACDRNNSFPKRFNSHMYATLCCYCIVHRLASGWCIFLSFSGGFRTSIHAKL